ncbi:nitroreductase family deazaflavin-dependent oxidoreductase [Prauserella cavernicola]|uniref:Nitroreductase family deazaflavin-dependent oxidoreductase n=1 Tax=Prauserella cavernicola TaxID=2800127 RepID=A0A934QP85_9PSEU|nr:nitroreductase family deazaflavin-dependent oxidoreductase [Prauserella cavernicola]MBK1782894.1 nitroreductase family deazaflavin-dependent oxidoreductase [Prauserella cavernicola]
MRNPLPALARALGTRPWLMKLAAAVVWADARLHRVSRGRVSLVGIAGLPSLRLTTRGRRSGLPRDNNLLYLPHGGDFVVTGSNWGRQRDPGWTFNLRADPHVTVLVRGGTVNATARELTGAEHEAMWRELLAFWPGYAMERAGAGRELPIFVLTPGDPPTGEVG